MGKLAERQLETSSKQVEFSTDGFAVKQFHSPIRNPEASLLETFRNQRKNCTELRVILLQEVLTSHQEVAWVLLQHRIQAVKHQIISAPREPAVLPARASPSPVPCCLQVFGQFSCSLMELCMSPGGGHRPFLIPPCRTPTSFMGSSTQHMENSSGQERKTLTTLFSERTKIADELLIITE